MSSAGLLGRFPVQWQDRRIQELHGSLAASIYKESDIEMLVMQAGVPPYDIPWGGSARRTWFAAMNEAAGRGALRDLVYKAVNRYPQLESRVTELLASKPVVGAPVPAGDPATLAAGDPRWRNFSADNRERRIVESQDTMLDVSFLQRGVESAKAVCRLTGAFGGRVYHGTAFRIGPRMLLTNHHVLHDWDNGEAPPTSVLTEFGYELDINGKLRTPIQVPCDVTTIRGEREHDFAVIEISTTMPPDAATLLLSPDVTVDVDSRVNIIQHPLGLPKKLALAHNLVRSVTEDVVQYWTDTEAGSSGSPVFDDDWRVVALHHQWVESPPDEGTAYRNQGRAISKVIERMTALGIEWTR